MMSFVAHPNPLKPNRLYRGVALFFLLFTLADLACPQLCRDELIEWPHSAAVPPAMRASTTTGPTETPARGAGLEEDCFCCCTHVLPSLMSHALRLEAGLFNFAPLPGSLPSPPPQDTFHPPRLV
jgi:hypothetical protein